MGGKVPTELWESKSERLNKRVNRLLLFRQNNFPLLKALSKNCYNPKNESKICSF